MNLQLRSVQNILRTPRLTQIYQKKMYRNITQFQSETEQLIRDLND